MCGVYSDGRPADARASRLQFRAILEHEIDTIPQLPGIVERSAKDIWKEGEMSGERKKEREREMGEGGKRA